MNAKQFTKRDLYLSFFLVAISLLLLLGATIAWFAMNKEVGSSGMVMRIDVTPTLVMGSTQDDLVSYKRDSIVYNGESDSSITDELPYYLKPATHDNAVGYTEGAGTGLKYNTNPTSVDYITGLQEAAAEDLQFQPVPVYGPDSAGRRYYIDYYAYISSDAKEMEVSAFNASLILLSPTDHNPDYFSSASVDFYVNGTTQGAFRGTLNLAGNEADGSPGDNILDLTGPATIPYIDTGYSTKVLMRFYFDGALEKTPGQAYVYSNNLTLENFHIGVHFDAVEIKDDTE